MKDSTMALYKLRRNNKLLATRWQALINKHSDVTFVNVIYKDNTRKQTAPELKLIYRITQRVLLNTL